MRPPGWTDGGPRSGPTDPVPTQGRARIPLRKRARRGRRRGDQSRQIVGWYLDDDLDTPGALAALDSVALSGIPVAEGACPAGHYPVTRHPTSGGRRQVVERAVRLRVNRPTGAGSRTAIPRKAPTPCQPSPFDFPMVRPRNSTRGRRPISSPSPSVPRLAKAAVAATSTGSRWTLPPPFPMGPRSG